VASQVLYAAQCLIANGTTVSREPATYDSASASSSAPAVNVDHTAAHLGINDVQNPRHVVRRGY
jgi:hypothetical protein